MRGFRVLFLTFLLIPTILRAQADGDSPAADTLRVPAGFSTEEGQFKQGKGVNVDTLDINDGRLLLVLRDDHTWYYIKNFKRMEADDTFVKDWIPNSINPFKTPLDSLPLRNSICLVDTASTFVCPNQTKVFSRFGFRHGRRHQGVDLPLKTGTPVVAAFDGRVRVSTYNKGYGNLVVIRHENGLETFYGHLSKREVEVGQWVRAGDQIGLGGSTGRSTGPHLHFETRYQGYAFDPEWIADYEKGELRKNVFVLRRSYLDAGSRYVPESLDEEEAPMKLFSSDAISSASANSRFTTCTSTSGSTDTSSALTIMLKNGRFTGFVMTMMMFVRSSVRILTFPWMIPFSAAVAAVDAALGCDSSAGAAGWRARIMLGIRRGSGLATRATSSFCSLSLASSLSRAAMSAAFACRMTYTLVSTFSSVGWSTISKMSLIRRKLVDVSSTSSELIRSSRCTFPYPCNIAPTMLFASSIPRYFSRINWLTSASLSGYPPSGTSVWMAIPSVDALSICTTR